MNKSLLLKKYSKEFIKDALEICKNEIKEYPLKEKTGIEVKFVSNKFDECIKKTTLDNIEFFSRNSLKEKFFTLDTFNIISTYISEQKSVKKFFKDRIDKFNEKENSDIQEHSNNLVFSFIEKFVEEKKDFSFNDKIFQKIFKTFEQFIQKDILYIDFFTPLHNFSSNVNKIEFDDMILKKISENEFKIISKLDSKNDLSSVYDLMTLEYVLKISLPFQNDSKKENDEAKEQFSTFLNALKIFDHGDVQMGALYRNFSFWMEKDYSSIIGEESHVHSNTIYNLEKNKKDFSDFFHEFSKINFESNELQSLKIAIKRFEIAKSRKSIDDKIIDLITSLESLYSGGPGDSLMKLSNRISLFLEDSEDQRESLWDFMKQVYNFRSGIVHGDSKRIVSINGKKANNEEIGNLLETISRNSIKKFLIILKNHSGKNMMKKIRTELDVGLINRKRLVEFKKNLDL